MKCPKCGYTVYRPSRIEILDSCTHRAYRCYNAKCGFTWTSTELLDADLIALKDEITRLERQVKDAEIRTEAARGSAAIWKAIGVRA